MLLKCFGQFMFSKHFETHSPVLPQVELLPELFCGIFPLGGINVTDDHLGPFSEEALGKLKAYSLGPASYNCPVIRLRTNMPRILTKLRCDIPAMLWTKVEGHFDLSLGPTQVTTEYSRFSDPSSKLIFLISSFRITANVLQTLDNTRSRL